MINIERLKEAKKRMKITYEELSSLSGVPISTIYDLFRGVTTDPRAGTLEAIERALGLSEDGSKDSLMLSDEEKRLVLLYRAAPAEGRNAAIRLLQSYSP